jgi:DNA-binding response OmpR family regulator
MHFQRTFRSNQEEVVQLLRYKPQQEGHHALSACDSVERLRVFREQSPHLVLLDLMLPRMSGWEACWHIREYSDVPIIMLTALGTKHYMVRGLELGAGDCVAKPFSPAELIARVQAALRCYGHTLTENSTVPIDNRLVIDCAGCRAVIHGQKVELSSTEYWILDCFLDCQDRVLTHQVC